MGVGGVDDPGTIRYGLRSQRSRAVGILVEGISGVADCLRRGCRPSLKRVNARGGGLGIALVLKVQQVAATFCSKLQRHFS